MHTCLRAQTFVSVRECVCTLAYAHKHLCLYNSVYAHLLTRTHICSCTYLCMHFCTCILLAYLNGCECTTIAYLHAHERVMLICMHAYERAIFAYLHAYERAVFAYLHAYIRACDICLSACMDVSVHRPVAITLYPRAMPFLAVERFASRVFSFSFSSCTSWTPNQGADICGSLH